nr:gamma-aminobutyric acid receptor-associated protein-like 2 isoform X1 [Oryctolagus cuniculus]
MNNPKSPSLSATPPKVFRISHQRPGAPPPSQVLQQSSPDPVASSPQDTPATSATARSPPAPLVRPRPLERRPCGRRRKPRPCQLLGSGSRKSRLPCSRCRRCCCGRFAELRGSREPAASPRCRRHEVDVQGGPLAR